jgi:hypothetical protein
MFRLAPTGNAIVRQLAADAGLFDTYAHEAPAHATTATEEGWY